MIKMTNITKTFPGVKALDSVNLEANDGRILALIGINGAGKSTLMNVLGGVLKHDSGSIVVNGEEKKFRNPKESQQAGIAFIHQEPVFFASMTVAENIFISDLFGSGVPGVIDKKKAIRESKNYLSQLGTTINPKAKMEDISIGERQIVEIARALALGAHTIIFDEPTSSLSLNEKEKLFEVINTMKADGKTIIYISHFLDEIMELCDDYLVLRDGKTVGMGSMENVTKNDLVRLIIGQDIGVLEKKTPTINKEKEVVLRVKNVNRGNLLKGVEFDLYKGEVLGICGLMGSGRTELIRSMFGLDYVDSCETYLSVNGELKKAKKQALLRSCGYLTENRHHDGLFLQLPIWENITAPSLGRYSSRVGFMKEKDEYKSASEFVKKLSIKVPDATSLASQLSGGNQQKVIVAKWLDKNADILILDEPTRGVDVGSKLEIQKLVRKIAEEGKSVILISSEMDEMADLSDRVIVLRGGKICEEVTGSDINSNNLMSLALAKEGVAVHE